MTQVCSREVGLAEVYERELGGRFRDYTRGSANSKTTKNTGSRHRFVVDTCFPLHLI